MHRIMAVLAAIAAVAILSGCAGTSGGSAGDRLFNADQPLAIADQGYFFVGGSYTQTKDGQIHTGQMFVQYQVPANRRSPFPVIMIHGGGQTGTNFLGTPDGRRGWADYFLAQGYAVYVVDQAGRARSGFYTDVYGRTRRPNAVAMSSRFTAPANKKLWPHSGLHTQWPGSGVAGDPVFDQFFASQVEDIADVAMIERLNRDAGAALLDKIGPAIVLTHSQSGPIGWVMADARPQQVKAVVAIEPSGPPQYDVAFTGAPNWFRDGAIARPWGITRGPIAYSPAASDVKELRFVQQEKPDHPDLVRCRVQAEPARKLPNLAGIPILIVVSEASYHTPYDHCTSKFLTQAGVANTFVRLPDAGIRGNAHMMMLEKNNLEIAALLQKWIAERVK